MRGQHRSLLLVKMDKHSLKIAILDCTKTFYNEELSKEMPLGGIERCIISLSREFSNKGHTVQVFSNGLQKSTYQNIDWLPKHQTTNFKADIVIACNDPKLFDSYALQSGHTDFKPYLWHHNPVGFWKTIRKGRLLPLIKWTPTIVLLGTSHLKTYPKILSFNKKVIIEHGIETSILKAPPLSVPPPPHAAYISQSYRGLNNLIHLWKNEIFPANPRAKLFVYSSYENNDDLSAFGISIEGRQSREKLLNSLSNKRITLIPGHPDETFCLSALESLCLGIPVISFGIGALKERISDGQNGFIVRDNMDFAAKTIRLLNDDSLWQTMSQNAVESRSKSSWSQKEDMWECLFRGKIKI